MAKYTSKDYEEARQLEREDIFTCLQMAYETLMKMTNYNGQPDYEGDEADFNAYIIAQGISQATEMLMNIIDFVDQMKFEFEEGGRVIFLFFENSLFRTSYVRKPGCTFPGICYN